VFAVRSFRTLLEKEQNENVEDVTDNPAFSASRPAGLASANTSFDLVADMERGLEASPSKRL
jgi:hypothetical protein